jgi:anaerobic selenocysteine-containing dehydrogenase
MREIQSFCRICQGQCGVTVTVNDAGRIEKVRGDKANLLSTGYLCSKGVDSAEMHYRSDRILRPLKRVADGSMVEIPLEQARQEIAEKLTAIIARNGAPAVAAYLGTHATFNPLVFRTAPAFLEAIGSPSLFTSLTIDQSAKAITAARLGTWSAGPQSWDTSDVSLVFGMNPLVSIWSGFSIPAYNPTKRIKEAKARGLKLIVVDPRHTETAQYADIFLQPLPGEDTAIAAGLLRIIIAEGLHDADFCWRYVAGFDQLRDAIEPFTPDYVAARAGIDTDQLYAAARMFAGDGKRGCTACSTGVCMSPFSNLAAHMIELLNVVCGRVARAGEVVAYQSPFLPERTVHAEVVRPDRWWETSHTLRTGGFGALRTDAGLELPSAALPDEILTPGSGQIRALFTVGGNPASAFPDQMKTVTALESLDLLVAIEPFMTTTARLADYVIPPELMYERPDVPMVAGATFFPLPFGLYTPALVEPSPGSDVACEWQFFWDLARRLGKQLIVAGEALDMETAPTSEALLDVIVGHSRVPLDEMRRHPHGQMFPIDQRVQPAHADNAARFDALPHDVVEELRRYLSTARPDPTFTHLMTNRRTREVLNSLVPFPDRQEGRTRYNPAFMHSDDLAQLGVAPGESVDLVSEHGRITAIVQIDDALRSGVVSMSHSRGGLPGDPIELTAGAACTQLLVSTERHCETINGMPRMSSIPIQIDVLRG